MTPTSRSCSDCGAELHDLSSGRRLCPACSLRLAVQPATAATMDLPDSPSPEEGSPADGMPSRIGPYRLIEPLGDGGMGVVYRAEQREPVRREVAVKLIKWGMDTKQVAARFDSERQALALMDHPNIARVLDGGASRSGRPYFVMEYVRGVPITEFCDDQRLDPDERIELFLQVCDGVEHAHRKGIIHRDLKPSNILVHLQDGRPKPKIIDFGVAKAIGLRLSQDTVHTQLGQWIGTPDYMSPEQAESRLDVDTRSDVYSLGVLLHELLVGERPFDIGSIDRTRPDTLRRALRETEPVRPSSRLRRLGDEGRSVAEARRTQISSLIHRLRQDLDWILLKALEKEPARRYGSVAELSADLRRHLEGLPVLARAPSLPYRAGKLVRRHAVATATGLMVVIALGLGSVVATWQAVRATRAERRASLEAETSRQVARFLTELFKVSNPSQAQGETVTARELLDQAAARIGDDLRDQPLVRAEMMETIGTVYQNLGLYARARPLLEGALEIRRRELGEEHLDVAESLSDLARHRHLEGRFEEATRLNREAYEMQRRLGADARALGETLNGIAATQSKLGDYEAARATYEEILALWEEELGPRHPDVARILNNLAGTYWHKGEYRAARPFFERSLQIKEAQLGPNHPSLSASLNNLGLLLWRLEDFDGARRLFERALEIDEISLGPEHPDVAASLNNLAIVLKSQGDFAAAEPLYRRAIAIKSKSVGPESPDVAYAISNLAMLHAAKGEDAQARTLHEQALAIRRKALGEDHPDLAFDLTGLAELDHHSGDLDGARAKFERAIALRETHLGPQHDLLEDTLRGYAALLRDLGEAETAARQEDRAAAIRRHKTEPE